MPIHIFVYGTLMTGFQNPNALYLHQNSLFISNGFLKGEMYDIGHYPGVILRGDTIVHGEIFQLKDETILHKLDFYEGCTDDFEKPYEYVRQLVEVNNSGGAITCWIYVYNWRVKALNKIETGDYKSHISRK